MQWALHSWSMYARKRHDANACASMPGPMLCHIIVYITKVNLISLLQSVIDGDGDILTRACCSAPKFKRNLMSACCHCLLIRVMLVNKETLPQCHHWRWIIPFLILQFQGQLKGYMCSAHLYIRAISSKYGSPVHAVLVCAIVALIYIIIFSLITSHIIVTFDETPCK